MIEKNVGENVDSVKVIRNFALISLPRVPSCGFQGLGNVVHLSGKGDVQHGGLRSLCDGSLPLRRSRVSVWREDHYLHGVHPA